MAATASNAVLDAGHDHCIATVNKIILCSAQPDDYAEAEALKLAEVSVGETDFIKSNGIASGRRLVCAAKSAIPVILTGTGNHIAWVDTVGGALKRVFSITSQAVTQGGTIAIASHETEISDPL